MLIVKEKHFLSVCTTMCIVNKSTIKILLYVMKSVEFLIMTAKHDTIKILTNSTTININKNYKIKKQKIKHLTITE